MKQQSLELFEGKEVELISVKFVGDPDRVIDKNEHGSGVAYLVLGTTDAVTFTTDKDNKVARDEKVKMSRVLQIDFSKAIAMLDEFDRQARESQGVYALPFDGDASADCITCPECSSLELTLDGELKADEAMCGVDCEIYSCNDCNYKFEEPI